ncbi:MAG: DUF2779 domain-containing protein [Candidatus Izemoplasmatales bacterium]
MVVTVIDLLNHLRCRRFSPLERRSTARKYNPTKSDEKYAEFRHLGGIVAYSATAEYDADETVELQKNRQYRLTDDAVRTMRDVVVTKILSQRPDMKIDVDKEFTYAFHDGYRLATAPDLLLSFDGVFEALTFVPMTSRELLAMQFSVNRTKYPLFVKDERNMYVPDLRGVSDAFKTNFDDKLAKLTDRHTDLGRIVYDVAFKNFILDRLFRPHAVKQLLVVLNHEYVHDGNPGGYGPSLIVAFDLTQIARRMAETIEIDLYRMINHVELDDDSRCPLVKSECRRGMSFQCPYVEYCFSHLPKRHSVFHYFFQHQGFVESLPGEDVVHDTYELVNQGVVDMLDVPISWLKREKNLMQRYCVENERPFYNKIKLKTYLDTLRYPLYLLDFEAFPAILPRFRGESPYSQSLFQFSVHVVERPGDDPGRDDPATHREWVAKDGADRRREFVEALLTAIPPGDSSVVVYNQNFEKNRLVELATLFPEHADRLRELAGRLFDLLKAVKNDADFFLSAGFTKEAAETYNYYHPDLDGTYSLKKVLPALGGADYEGMPIANGVQAYLAYASLDELEPEEREKTLRDLRSYCGLDTYAMHLILAGIRAQIA